jgi:hypothetical protein
MARHRLPERQCRHFGYGDSYNQCLGNLGCFPFTLNGRFAKGDILDSFPRDFAKASDKRSFMIPIITWGIWIASLSSHWPGADSPAHPASISDPMTRPSARSPKEAPGVGGPMESPIVQVVGPTDQWILERLARRLAAKLPYARFVGGDKGT